MRLFICQIVLIQCAVGVVPVLGQETAHVPPRQELAEKLRAARAAFDRGSSLLHKAPDDALAAFREARDAYEFVIDAGIQNGKLHYNLGNTHMRLGNLGLAIAEYRQAERLLGEDGSLSANLRFARSLRRDQIESSGTSTLLQTLFVWHYAIPLRFRLTAGLVFYVLFWILLACRSVLRRTPLRYATVVCFVIWGCLAISVGVDWRGHSGSADGVLVSDDVTVRKGNGEGYAPQFQQPLHEGVEFSVLEVRGGWVHIELPDENRGWIRGQDAVLF